MQTITFNNQQFTLINLPDNNSYYINNKGDVYSTITNKVLKTCISNSGYHRVTLFINNKKRYSVHRLMGLTFIPNPESNPEINHKNGVKNDNSIENLEWVTHRQNIQHAFDTGLKINPMFGRTGEKCPMFGKFGDKHHNSKKVICVETNEVFGSAHCVQRKYGYRRSFISRVCRGKQKSAYGFHWKYI